MIGRLQKQKNIAGALAFWMANASELLNFAKQDKDLSRITLDGQDVLAHLVQMAFKWVNTCSLNSRTNTLHTSEHLLRRDNIYYWLGMTYITD